MAPTKTIDGISYFIQSCYESKGSLTANIGVSAGPGLVTNYFHVEFYDDDRVVIDADRNLRRENMGLTTHAKAELRQFIQFHCD